MTQALDFHTLDEKIISLEKKITELAFQDTILEERIDGKFTIAEHTNIFLDIVFILLSVVLWVITMQGWRNSKDVEKEREQLRELLERDREEVTQYKNNLAEDRKKFEIEYHKTIAETLRKINESKTKIEERYKKMQQKYEEIITDIRGVSEYYLELVAISHEPDLSERVFEYEKILKNSEKYNLSHKEKARVNYYLSITLYQLATKTPEAKNKIVSEWIKKASKCISNAIDLVEENGSYFYEKAKIELEKYRLQLINDKNFEQFSEKIYAIEEYFSIAFQAPDVEFYMYEEMILLFHDFPEKLAKKESEKRVILNLISIWCDKAKKFDYKSYIEDLQAIKKDTEHKLSEQNQKLDNDIT